MRWSGFLAPLLLLAGCASAASRPAPDAEWLSGTWLEMAEGVEFPLACDSGLPVQYHSDGSYHLFEESGTWRLYGARLTETATFATEAADPESVELGRPFVSRLERRGPDLMIKTLHDGTRITFRRCPAR